MKPVTVFISLAAGLPLLGGLGLRIKPAPFAPIREAQPRLETVPPPKNLPAPVERFYRTLYGDQVPVIKTAVISGRGTLRIGGIPFPARFRFTHETGRNYRHYIELTFFGLPIVKVNEYYLGGRERMEFPWGVQENNPKLDQGGVLGMWAELAQWIPAALVTDPRVRWEPVDEETAWLIVPFGGADERFLARFDAAGRKLKYLESMRYQNGEGDKMLWINGAWFDQGRPWAIWNVEETVYNVDVNVSFEAKGA